MSADYPRPFWMVAEERVERLERQIRRAWFVIALVVASVAVGAAILLWANWGRVLPGG